jgi:two-component system chemotaxis response regulator CheB
MAHQPIPIVVHSSGKNRGEIYKTWDIMKAGALASIEKIETDKDTPTWERNLFRTIRAASQVKAIRHRTYLSAQQAEITTPSKKKISKNYNIIAFGTSTGGPVTIAKILNAFPPDFEVPILTVMHTKDSTAFCSWLGNNCKLKVAFASDGDRLDEQKGKVLLPPNNTHLIVKKNRIVLCESPPVNFCKPSIDVLFNSLARDKTLKSIAVLLTGMGEDGAQGLKAIRDSGGYTICQDEETSVIYGMPKVAINLGAAETVLPDHQIADKIVSFTITP